jgi:hypothetical protein
MLLETLYPTPFYRMIQDIITYSIEQVTPVFDPGPEAKG